MNRQIRIAAALVGLLIFVIPAVGLGAAPSSGPQAYADPGVTVEIAQGERVFTVDVLLSGPTELGDFASLSYKVRFDPNYFEKTVDSDGDVTYSVNAAYHGVFGSFAPPLPAGLKYVTGRGDGYVELEFAVVYGSNKLSLAAGEPVLAATLTFELDSGYPADAQVDMPIRVFDFKLVSLKQVTLPNGVVDFRTESEAAAGDFEIDVAREGSPELSESVSESYSASASGSASLSASASDDPNSESYSASESAGLSASRSASLSARNDPSSASYSASSSASASSAAQSLSESLAAGSASESAGLSDSRSVSLSAFDDPSSESYSASSSSSASSAAQSLSGSLAASSAAQSLSESLADSSAALSLSESLIDGSVSVSLSASDDPNSASYSESYSASESAGLSGSLSASLSAFDDPSSESYSASSSSSASSAAQSLADSSAAQSLGESSAAQSLSESVSASVSEDDDLQYTLLTLYNQVLGADGGLAVGDGQEFDIIITNPAFTRTVRLRHNESISLSVPNGVYSIYVDTSALGGQYDALALIGPGAIYADRDSVDLTGGGAVSYTVINREIGAPAGTGGNIILVKHIFENGVLLPAEAGRTFGIAVAGSRVGDSGELEPYSSMAAVAHGSRYTLGTGIGEFNVYEPDTADAAYRLVGIYNLTAQAGQPVSNAAALDVTVGGAQDAVVAVINAAVPAAPPTDETAALPGLPGGGSSGAIAPEGGQSDTEELGDTELPGGPADAPDGYAPPKAFVTDHIPYINGYPDGTVKPDGSITRAELSVMLFRLLADANKNAPVPSTFPDVAEGAWYAQSVNYLAGIGVINGYEDRTFRPDARITRAEFVKIVSGFDDIEEAGAAMFADVSGHWAERFVNSAFAKGWISGYSDGTFRPQGDLTRAEAATIVNRIMYRGIEASDIPSWAAGYADLSEGHWAYSALVEATTAHNFTRKDNGFELWTKP